MTRHRPRLTEVLPDSPGNQRGQSLRAAALVAVALDVATTAWIVTSPSYVDLNLIVAELERFGPGVALTALAAFDLALFAVAWRRGWLGTATATFLVIAPGSGGLNNLVLFLTGVSVMGALGGSVVVHLLVPVVAGVASAVTATSIHGVPVFPQPSVDVPSPGSSRALGAVLAVIAAIALTGLVAYISLPG